MPNKIVFMGTPDFAVESLKQILNNGIEVAGVITAPDRKSGRGQKINESAVKKFAKEKDLNILQPENLKDEGFQKDLRDLNADLFVVVAFRMLPESVWGMPPMGTINLHGSLLPQYRGAAPINWAVMNGDVKTGATTFFIEKEIDTGKIIDSVEIDIAETHSAGDVHDHLMVKGAELLSQTVQNIFDGNIEAKDQMSLAEGLELRPAPKIFKDDCLIDWKKSVQHIYNKIRGLSPYPTAWTVLYSEKGKKSLKIFSAEKQITQSDNSGQLIVENDKVLFGCVDGWILPSIIQLEGKKKMAVKDVMNGFDFNQWKLTEA
jgi:methionyl-tRNA formyltransferase